MRVELFRSGVQGNDTIIATLSAAKATAASETGPSTLVPQVTPSPNVTLTSPSWSEASQFQRAVLIYVLAGLCLLLSLLLLWRFVLCRKPLVAVTRAGHCGPGRAHRYHRHVNRGPETGSDLTLVYGSPI
ncbi:uncharacterized protein LOC143299092 [Babylonia areolata]|uniref:uncharacterized protein LOC143299092 n=1 Tax=Babylonia areolata TaxID=304850 RepID=UPI003FD0EF02